MLVFGFGIVNYIVFCDWDLNILNLSLSNSQIIYPSKVLAYYSNEILIQQSDGSLQLWSLSNQQFTYLGGFPSKIFQQSSSSMISFYRVILLPIQNIFYIDYNGLTNNTAYYYKLDHPTRNKLG